MSKNYINVDPEFFELLEMVALLLTEFNDEDFRRLMNQDMPNWRGAYA